MIAAMSGSFGRCVATSLCFCVAASLTGFLQAQTDDNMATIYATMAGQTNTGIVYRNGKALVANLSLPAGTNFLSVTAIDAAGNNSTTNVTVIKSAVTVTIDPLSSGQLNQSYVTATGTVSDTGQGVARSEPSGRGAWV